MSVQYPEAKKFLEDMGVDPSLVNADSVTEHGYQMFVRDRHGRRLWRGRRQLRYRGRSWPSPRFGRVVVGLMRLREAAPPPAD